MYGYSNKRIVFTKHARERIRQRFGLSVKVAKKFLEWYGVRHETPMGRVYYKTSKYTFVVTEQGNVIRVITFF